MLKDTDRVELYNRNNGVTGYTIAEKGIRRQFAPGETKKITMEELTLLSYQEGGRYLLDNLFIIKNKEALDQLGMEVELEYNYTKKDVKRILLSPEKDSIDELTDLLNFAPEGVIEIAKDIAVNEEIPDSRKRQLITDKTGFNIDGAIQLRKKLAEPTEEELKAKAAAAAEAAAKAVEKPTRRVNKTPAKPQRVYRKVNA